MSGAEFNRYIENPLPGTHISCIYRTPEEQFAVVIPFLSAGIKNRERILYIADETFKAVLIGHLDKLGIDAKVYFSNQDIIFVSDRAAYLRDGFFDSDRMILFLQETLQAALKDKYKGLRVVSELAWVLPSPAKRGQAGPCGAGQLTVYVSKLTRFLPQSKIIAVSQYDERQFDPRILIDVLKTQPKILLYHKVLESCFYMPLDILDSMAPEDASMLIYQKMVEHIQKRAELEEQNSRAQKAVRESEEAVKTIINASSEAVMILDRGGLILSANKTAAIRFARTADQMVGLNAFDLVSPKLAESGRKILANIAATGKPALYEDHSDGVIFRLNVYPIFDPTRAGGSEVTRFAIISHNIHERRQVEDQLKQHNYVLSTINSLATELASLPPDTTMHKWLTEKLIEITGATVAWSSDYEATEPASSGGALVLRHLEIKPFLLEKLCLLFGKNPKDMRTEVSEENCQYMARTTVGRMKTLTEASFGSISPMVSATVQKLVGINRFIGLSYVAEGKLLAISGLAMKAVTPDPPDELLELFARIVSIALLQRTKSAQV